MGDGWLSYPVLGNEVWRFGVLFLLLIGAVVVYYLTRVLVKRFSPAAGNETGRKAMLNILQRLLRVVLPLLVVWVSLQIFLIPVETKRVIDSLFMAVLTVFILYLITKLVDVLTIALKARALRTKSKLDDQLLPLLSKALKGFVWGIGLLLFLQNVLNYNISSLLAALGIGGLAFAFAAQDMIANIFGTVMIFTDRPFQVGDAVSIEGFEGAIEAIGLRSTRLRTWDGTLVTIPNRTVASANINNLAARPMRRTNFTLGLVYDTPTAKLEEALAIVRDILKDHPSTGQYRAYFNKFGDFSLDILVQHWCNLMDYDKYLQSLEEINLEIKHRFEAAGIEFAFPTQTLYLKPEQTPLNKPSS
ncbi:TPA: hypothetical protein DIT45_02195 [Candidatus Acetothermia bacterium]|nr:hypothetical protein [Candidatus Acetothermia bacterium]